MRTPTESILEATPEDSRIFLRYEALADAVYVDADLADGQIMLQLVAARATEKYLQAHEGADAGSSL